LFIITISNKLGLPSSDTYGKNDMEEGNNNGDIDDMGVLDGGCVLTNKDVEISANPIAVERYVLI
jgi:hypothetical protein